MPVDGDEDDAKALERSAAYLERNGKPRSIILTAVCRVLRNHAARIRAQGGHK